MTIKPRPTLKSHILTTEEARALIDWKRPAKNINYLLPTGVVLIPGSRVEPSLRKGLIWDSLDESYERAGSEESSSYNRYHVAQVYDNTGDDGHVDYTLSGWLHITTHDLEHGPSTYWETRNLTYYLLPIYEYLQHLH